MKKYLKFWNILIVSLETILLIGTIIFMVLNKGENKTYNSWFAFNLSLNIFGPMIFSVYIAFREYKDNNYSMKTYTGLILGLMVMFGIGTSLAIDHLNLNEKASNIPWFYVASVGVFIISYIVGFIFEKKNDKADSNSRIKVNNKRG